MLFNSIEFALFLPLVFIAYWFIATKNLKAQNIIILLASYVFYAWWDWRFLILIIFSSAIDYSIGLKLSETTNQRNRKLLLYTSLFTNLGLLGFFKYYNFFLESFSDAFTLFGQSLETERLDIILPVGISFYTFQTLSYTIDIYRNKTKPTKDIISFFAFVNFFPQLVAGPIERAVNLLPQFQKKRTFNYPIAIDGLRQILWGLFKKIVIADNCAKHANTIFNNSDEYSGSTLLLGALFFTFQIYGDFSGYSDIAIGTSRLFGIDLKKNFDFPYFSRNIGEFWRRWHISLSTWFKDYLYIPLGGSKNNQWITIRNIMIVFLISGLWHGANWTFIVWGFINACYFIPLLLTKRNRKHLDTIAQGKLLPTIKETIQIGYTFLLTVLAWIFFRAENIKHAIAYISEIFSKTIFDFPIFPNRYSALTTLILILFFIIFEWTGRDSEYAIEKFGKKRARYYRWTLYYSIIMCIILFGANQQEFIYFQF